MAVFGPPVAATAPLWRGPERAPGTPPRADCAPARPAEEPGCTPKAHRRAELPRRRWGRTAFRFSAPCCACASQHWWAEAHPTVPLRLAEQFVGLAKASLIRPCGPSPREKGRHGGRRPCRSRPCLRPRRHYTHTGWIESHGASQHWWAEAHPVPMVSRTVRWFGAGFPHPALRAFSGGEGKAPRPAPCRSRPCLRPRRHYTHAGWINRTALASIGGLKPTRCLWSAEQFVDLAQASLIRPCGPPSPGRRRKARRPAPCRSRLCLRPRRQRSVGTPVTFSFRPLVG